MDEAGFALTLPTTYSWSPVGTRLVVPYEAPQGRRVNVIGAYFTHGPEAGNLRFVSLASLPKAKGKAPTDATANAAKHGITADEIGIFDSPMLLGFLWHLAGRPPEAPPGWERPVPLEIWLDNYSVHKSEAVKLEQPLLEAANVHLRYLPAYCPELSAIEPIWQDVKHRQMPVRSYTSLGALKTAVDIALTEKAATLLETAKSLATTA